VAGNSGEVVAVALRVGGGGRHAVTKALLQDIHALQSLPQWTRPNPLRTPRSTGSTYIRTSVKPVDSPTGSGQKKLCRI
jgi:hypothetical protein